MVVNVASTPSAGTQKESEDLAIKTKLQQSIAALNQEIHQRDLYELTLRQKVDELKQKQQQTDQSLERLKNRLSGPSLPKLAVAARDVAKRRLLCQTFKGAEPKPQCRPKEISLLQEQLLERDANEAELVEKIRQLELILQEDTDCGDVQVVQRISTMTSCASEFETDVQETISEAGGQSQQREEEELLAVRQELLRNAEAQELQDSELRLRIQSLQMNVSSKDQTRKNIREELRENQRRLNSVVAKIHDLQLTHQKQQDALAEAQQFLVSRECGQTSKTESNEGIPLSLEDEFGETGVLVGPQRFNALLVDIFRLKEDVEALQADLVRVLRRSSPLDEEREDVAETERQAFPDGDAAGGAQKRNFEHLLLQQRLELISIRAGLKTVAESLLAELEKGKCLSFWELCKANAQNLICCAESEPMKREKIEMLKRFETDMEVLENVLDIEGGS